MHNFYNLPIWIQIKKEYSPNINLVLSDDLLSYLYTYDHINDLPIMTQIGERLYDHLQSFDIVFSDSSYLESFYELYDSFVDNNLSNLTDSVFCQKGCSKCCYQPIKIYSIEADNIINKFQNLIDQDLLNEQNVILDYSYDSIQKWKKGLEHEKQMCTFLDANTGFCKIYNDRPLSCRNYFALNTDAYCAEDPNTVDSDDCKNARIIRFLEPAILTSCFSIMSNSDWLSIILKYE